MTTRVVAPEGGIIAGQSALVTLAQGPPRDTVLIPSVAMHLAFRSTPGGDYPRSLMGIVAHTRQTLLDAQHYLKLKADGSSRRLPFDPALDALAPALDRRLPVAIEADTRDEIHRALNFAEEFQFRPVIVGGRQAWKVAERLKYQNVPVVLRVGLSEPNEEREANLSMRARMDRNRTRWDERLNARRLVDAGVTVAIGSLGATSESFQGAIRQWREAGLSLDATLAALTSTPARLLGMEGSLGSVRVGRLANLVVCTGEPFTDRTKIVQTFIEGVPHSIETEEEGAPQSRRTPLATVRKPHLAEDFVGPASNADLVTETDASRTPSTRTGGNVLLRGATILTGTGESLPGTDLLIRAGKIAALGKGLPNQANVPEFDCRGHVVMPGIIDTHSHFAIAGGVNEMSYSVVPEVRIRDVVDGDDVQIYRAAAGGVTTARLLHGSANCIGGQDAVIKMKYGQPAHHLILHDAPRGVKFALGENVKRTDGRFPNTRLGVEAVFNRAFTEAQSYQKSWADFRSAQARGGSVPAAPRRDLRLEALSDILTGQLHIHCHCYRADEILMLLRVADQFGFRIKSLQHVLEGYKVAPEIARHGASCSLFSDWWAYKIEAYDAIPYAASLMRDAGVAVCLKSDSNELMRHMNQEAAKLVKYGGFSEADAIATITLNAAKQLGLEQRIGSLEVGKDADLAIFNGHPLNGFSRCEMTLIDGEVVFQRDKTLIPVPAAGSTTPVTASRFDLPAQPPVEYAVIGATVHPLPGRVVTKATLLIKNGKVVDVTSGSAPPGIKTVDATGLHVYPGMIDAGTVLGLSELESARETLDFQEGGDFQPDLRAAIAIHPDSELIPVTRANGVLAAFTRPTGSLIAGQGSLINLAGWVPREMAIVDPVALYVEFPSGLPFFSFFDPSVATMGRSLARKQRDEKVRKLKELFQQAVAYDAGRAAGTVPINPRLAALVPYAKGQKPVVIAAQREPDLREALRFAEESKLKVILSGATDAWKLTGLIKQAGVPVIVGPTMAMPQENDDPYDAAYANPARLHAAGIKFCIRSEGQSNSRNLPYNAAIAVAHGLPPEEGLRAVTLSAAEILGVADQLGSLETGKRAHFVVTTGDLLQPTTQVLAVAIDGKLLPPDNKQTRLRDRYRQRLKEVSEGKASLGTQ